MLVKNWMSTPVITVNANNSMKNAIKLLKRHHIKILPVIENGDLVGIITQDDLFKVLTTITGLDKRGIEFAFLVADRAKSIFKLADVIRKYNGHLISLFSTHEGAPPGARHVYLRAYQIDRKKLPELFEELKKETTLLYMVDHHSGEREMPHIYRLPQNIQMLS